MDYHAFLFWVIGGLTAACAIATVVTHNIVRAATWLLFTLGGTSALFFLIGADLVGAVQLLVYVGGTMVLVVFGVMLTAQGPFISMRTSSAEWAVSAATGIGLLALLILAIMSNKPADHPLGQSEPVVAFAPKGPMSDPDKNDNAATSSYTMVIGQGFAGVGVGPAHKEPNFRPRTAEPPAKDAKLVEPAIEKADAKAQDKKGAPVAEEAPNIIRTNYLLPFEIVSVHLLVVLIAAAFLARAKRWEARP